MVLLSFLLLSSCATTLKFGAAPKEGLRTFKYVDASGTYAYTRETKLIKNRLITRAQISAQAGGQKLLEKSVMVTQLGSVKGKSGRLLVSRPFASDFTVWLEAKRYDSKFRLETATKSMAVELTSPEEKWNGKSSVKVPKATLFCFFSQIPDCLYHNQLLTKAMERKGEDTPFYVVWDSYPYVQEQFSGVGTNLFAPAVVKYDGELKSIRRYVVEVNGQSVLYHFSKSFDLVRMLWIAQGVSIVPPDEDMSDVEE